MNTFPDSDTTTVIVGSTAYEVFKPRDASVRPIMLTVTVPKAIGANYATEVLGKRHASLFRRTTYRAIDSRYNLFEHLDLCSRELRNDATVHPVLTINFQHPVKHISTTYLKALFGWHIKNIPYSLFRQLVKFEGLESDDMVLLAHIESNAGHRKVNYALFYELINADKELLISELATAHRQHLALYPGRKRTPSSLLWSHK